MRTMTATDAARKFADLLDAVEHHGETIVVERRGKPVASISPASKPNGQAVKDLLSSTRPDPEWAEEIRATRALLVNQERHWPD